MLLACITIALHLESFCFYGFELMSIYNYEITIKLCCEY